MKKYFSLLLLLFCITINITAQDSTSIKLRFLEPAPELHKGRTIATVGIWASAYGSSLYMLSTYWYDELEGFRVFNDNANWLQVDKFGHAYTAYFQGHWGIKTFKWAGMKHLPATLIGGSVGFVNETVIEILDGRSPTYGWSHGDFIANTAGTALLIGQELIWKEQRILMKFGYTPQDYSRFNSPLISQTALDEFGTGGEAFFKDYNGHNYWLSGNVYSFLKKDSQFPKWLNVAVGLGGDQMLHAVGNENNGITDLKRRREFYLSLDADLTRLKSKTHLGKTLLFLLNGFKIPFPALRYNSDGDFDFVPLAW